MTSTFTTGKAHLEQPASGDYPNAWAGPVNADWATIDACMSGTTSIALTNVNVILTQPQMQAQRILLTGTLTGSVSVLFPSTIPGNFIIDNRTTGAFSVFVVTTAVSSVGITSPQGYRSFVFTDGTNVNLCDDGTPLPQPGSVTNALLANMAANTVKANLTGGAASPTDTPIATLSYALQAITPSFISSVSGLLITNGASPLIQVNISANSAVLTTAGGYNVAALNGISVSANVSTSGVNGLDTGSVSANTWYYGYIIYNLSTLTVAALLSVSASSPVLPSGYSYSVFIGAVCKTDGSGNFYLFKKRGNMFRWTVASGTNTSNLPFIINYSTGNVSIPVWSNYGVQGNSGPFPTSLVPASAQTISTIAGSIYGGGGSVIVAPNSNYGGVNSTVNPPPIQSYGSQYISKEILIEFGGSIYLASNSGGSTVVVSDGFLDSANVS